MPGSSSLARWRYQASASFPAWAVILVVGAVLHHLLRMPSRYLISMCLCSGVALVLINEVDFSKPRSDRVDIEGAFSKLWWSACWPRYRAKR
jgi:hypothetical protein